MNEPSSSRTFADESARASRAINDTIKRLTGGNANMMDGFPSYLQAAQEYNSKVLEYTISNTMAMFDYVRKLSEAKTTPELVELTTSHARTQFDTLTAQAKELQAIVQKAMPAMPAMPKMGGPG
jgi:hypothetical protein